METHVKVLAWFNLVLGGLGIVLAALVIGGGAILAEVLPSIPADVDIPMSVIQLVATIITVVVLTASLPCLALGYGLLNLRPWARVLGIVLSAINLLNVPFGTAVALYAFWVLLKPETEALFRRQAAAT
jgi:hypothetical protein